MPLGWTDNQTPFPNLTVSSEAFKPVMSKIQIEGVCKIYASKTGRVMALENVDLTIKQNEFITLVGPSGCGKSTLLKADRRTDPAVARRASLRRSAAPQQPTRDVGIVFQEPALLPWRSVLDNILLPAEILGLDMGYRVAKERSPLELIELTGLAGFETQDDPHELSGGMQQRVAICRALIQASRPCCSWTSLSLRSTP